MSRIAYVNGRYLPQRDAAVNIEDRGYQLGDGVYEVVHLHDGRFIDEDRHLARLERSLRELRMAMPMSRAALLHVLAEVARRNRVREGLLYMQVTRGVARRDHAFPPAGTPPALVVTIRRIPPYPRDVGAWTGAAITQPDQRWARCDIKSVGLLPNVLARQAAREQGAVEAILVDAQGMVTEGAATSFWIVDEAGVLRVRHLDHAILPGCTRAALLDLLAEAGIALRGAGVQRRGDAARARSVHHQRHQLRQADRAHRRCCGRRRAGGAGDAAPVRLFARHVRGPLRNAA